MPSQLHTCQHHTQSVFLEQEKVGVRQHSDPRPGYFSGPPHRPRFMYTSLSDGDPQWCANTVEGLCFHRACLQLRILPISQLARREIAPHRAALSASLNRISFCSLFGTWPPLPGRLRRGGAVIVEAMKLRQVFSSRRSGTCQRVFPK